MLYYYKRKLIRKVQTEYNYSIVLSYSHLPKNTKLNLNSPVINNYYSCLPTITQIYINAIHHLLPIVFDLSLKLFVTTETELNAIAAPAAIGFNKNPQIGKSKPAATGIPITL